MDELCVGQFLRVNTYCVGLLPMPPVGEPPEVPPSPPEGGGEMPRKHIARLDFEMGLSLRVIGAKVGVSEGTVRLWAKQGGWLRPEGSKTPEHPPASVTPPAPPQSPVQGEMGGVASGAITHSATHDAAGATQTPERVVGAKSNVTVLRPERPPIGVPVGDGPLPPAQEAKRLESNERILGEDGRPVATVFRDRVQELLVNPTPDEAADVAARAVVSVVKGHRVGISKAQALCDQLLGQLEVAAGSRDLLEEFIIAETEPGKYRSMLMRLVSLSSHAGTLKDLALAMSRLVQLERQAFGLSEKDDPTPPPSAPPAPERIEDAHFAAIRERVQKRIAAPQGVSDVSSKAPGDAKNPAPDPAGVTP